MGLEDNLQGNEGSLGNNTQGKNLWIRKAFKQEWPTMGNHLAACVVSISAATTVSHFGDNFLDSDAAISGLATFVDSTSYWGAFLPQLIWRDRERLKDGEGNFDRKKVLKKVGEYGSYITFIEGTYIGLRFLGQYHLQKKGWDPAVASATIQGIATGLFTAAWPIIRYAGRKLSEKQ